MYHYLGIEKNEGLNNQFYVISLKRFLLFTVKQVILLTFLVYAVLFLAVSTPFLENNSLIIYSIGMLVAIYYTLRLFLHLFFYLVQDPVSLVITSKSIIINCKSNSYCIERGAIKALIHTFTDILIIKDEKRSYIFPLLLIEADDRYLLLHLFKDIFPKRSALIDRCLEFSHAITLALLLAVHIIQYCAQNYYIPTGSMRNTLIEDDHIFAEKMTYGIRIPKMLFMDKAFHLSLLQLRAVTRGDIVIFVPPGKSDNDVEFIKRVIAIPGDLFLIKKGRVFINGRALDEPYALGTTEYHGDDTQNIDGYVPTDMVIVLGDNRPDSQDSRIFGFLPIDNIRARAFFLYFNSGSNFNSNIKRFGVIN